jgi:hypothetical protein
MNTPTSIGMHNIMVIEKDDAKNIESGSQNSSKHTHDFEPLQISICNT